MSLKNRVHLLMATGVGIGVVALSGQQARAQQADGPPPSPAPAAGSGWLSTMFNNSDVTSTGWALPLATLNTDGSTTLRTELGYADPIPGLYVNHKFGDSAAGTSLGEADLGFMNFSEMVFPLGDTLNFNSKGDLYSNGEETDKQLGLRYRNTLTLDDTSHIDYSAFAGWSVFKTGPSTGMTADYHKTAGSWDLLAGVSAAWLGEQDGMALNAIAAASRHFNFEALPDGKFTTGLLLKDEGGHNAAQRATLFAEYQTHLVTEDGPRWMRSLSGLFGAYSGTESWGGKAGLLYTPHKVGAGNKDFGVSFGPSVGWDSKERGPQFNLELRAGF